MPRPSHSYLFDHPNNIGWWVQIIKFLIMYFLHSAVTSSLLGPNILLSTLLSNTLNLCPSLNVSDQVSYLLTYLLTYSMVQSPSWEANWFAVSQEIPRISRNSKVHYRTHKRPPPVSILGQPNPVHIPTSHRLEIHPNIIHPPRSPPWSPSLRFPQQDPIHPPVSYPHNTKDEIIVLNINKN